MIHPDTELKFIHRDIGFGVVATQPIPKGTITWVLDKLDRVIFPDDPVCCDPKYTDILDKYAFRNNKGEYILCWDHGRFINHSFNPNCMTTAYNFELAIRDIRQGEELTNDYSTLNLEAPFSCIPERNIKRRMVLPEDFRKYFRKWDRQLLSAFQNFQFVSQPLAIYLEPSLLRKARAIACGKSPMDSILGSFFIQETPQRQISYTLNKPEKISVF